MVISATERQAVSWELASARARFVESSSAARRQLVDSKLCNRLETICKFVSETSVTPGEAVEIGTLVGLWDDRGFL